MFYGYGRRKKLLEERQVKTRQKLPYNRFLRVSAQLQNQQSGEVVTGRVFLHDLNDKEVTLFVSEPILRETEVFVVIEHPKHLFIRGKVSWCNLYQLNMRILSVESYKYRAKVQFIYESDEDRLLVQEYFKSIFE